MAKTRSRSHARPTTAAVAAHSSCHHHHDDPPPPPTPRLRGQLAHLQTMLQRLARSRVRLEETLLRLGGGPTNGPDLGGTRDVSGAASALGEFDVLLNQLETECSARDTLLDQLESLV